MPLNIPDLLEELLVAFNIRTKEKNLQIIKDISPSASHSYIGDPTRIRQILINLIGNAIKFTAKGHVKISVLDSTPDSDHVRFEIEDTGIGIPEKNRKNMFQKFSQGDTSTTRKFGGTGLGLAICKNLVELMGGEIGFFGNVYGGTTFWFTLPLQKTSINPLSSAQHSANQDFSGLKGRKILLAEDNKVNQEYATKILNDMGLHVILAETGIEAITHFQQPSHHIEAILMDCRMPDMDGYHATQEIRKLESAQNRKRIPIIALTANVIKGDIERCHQAGMDDYLSKPIHRRTLENTLLRWMNNSQQAPHSPESIAPQLSAPSFEIIDMSVYGEMAELMADDMNLMVRHYLDSLSMYIGMIKDGLDKRSMKQVAESAHPLKSSSASLGAIQMRDVCIEIESIANQNGDSQKLIDLISRLESIAQKTEIKLKEIAA